MPLGFSLGIAGMLGFVVGVFFGRIVSQTIHPNGTLALWALLTSVGFMVATAVIKRRQDIRWLSDDHRWAQAEKRIRVAERQAAGRSPGELTLADEGVAGALTLHDGQVRRAARQVRRTVLRDRR